MSTINVSLKDRSYTIVIGKDLLRSAGNYLRKMKAGKKVLVVSQRKVAIGIGFYSQLKRSLERSGFEVALHLLKNGTEKDKSVKELTRIWNAMTTFGMDRSSTIAALGGGVVGDVAGFAASTYMRGIRMVQIPTTLLAQVDSAIGGKTGIDFDGHKNLIGTFCQPQLVLSDITILARLPVRVLRQSFSEIIKYGVIDDPKIIQRLECDGKDFLHHASTGKWRELDFKFIGELVLRSARIKARIVSSDERETRGLRMILNYGHTFAHAFESASGYAISHGDAVSLGMNAAAQFAYRIGFTSGGFAMKQYFLLQSLGLPVSFPDIRLHRRLSWAVIKQAFFHDKKTQDGIVRFILPRRFGKVDIYRATRKDFELIRSILVRMGVQTS